MLAFAILDQIRYQLVIDCVFGRISAVFRRNDPDIFQSIHWEG